MKITHSNCWCFYYSGAFGRTVPTVIVGVFITPCTGQNFPAATAGVFITLVYVRTTQHNPRPTKNFLHAKVQ